MTKHFSLFNFRKKTLGFLRDDEGASAIEYAIIAGLIAVAFIAAAGPVGEKIGQVFGIIDDKLESVVTEADDETTP